MALSAVFHSINSHDSSLLPHFVLPVFFLLFGPIWVMFVLLKGPVMAVSGPISLQIVSKQLTNVRREETVYYSLV